MRAHLETLTCPLGRSLVGRTDGHRNEQHRNAQPLEPLHPVPVQRTPNQIRHTYTLITRKAQIACGDTGGARFDCDSNSCRDRGRLAGWWSFSRRSSCCSDGTDRSIALCWHVLALIILNDGVLQSGVHAHIKGYPSPSDLEWDLLSVLKLNRRNTIRKRTAGVTAPTLCHLNHYKLNNV